MRQEAEAARRQEQTAELERRAAELESAAESLRREAGSGEEVLPAALASALGSLTTELDESERLAAQLEQASGAEWEAARSRLEAALEQQQAARERAAEALADWQRREAEALAARAKEGLPIDPATGLIEGLDGGDYEQYLVSVVERVQRNLRRRGIYAGPVDGRFDSATLEAVGRYQEANGLQVSGVPSPLTRAKLLVDPD